MTTTTTYLFTNVKTVTVNEVRATVSVLMLNARMAQGGHWVRRAVAFGVDAAWHVFDVTIPTVEHELLVRQLDDPHGHDAVQVVGGPCFFIEKDTWDEPVNVTRIEFDEDDADKRDHANRRIRELIARDAAHYWQAPNMPGLLWGRREVMAQYNLKMVER